MKVCHTEYHLFRLLKLYENQHLPLDIFLGQYFRVNKQLGARDRRTISQAAFGLCRWRSLIDYLVENDQTWENRYSLFSEFQPENYIEIETIPTHIRLSFPEQLFSLLVAEYNELRARLLCQVSNTEAPTTIRINPVKTSRDNLLQKWSALGPEPCQNSPLGIQFKKRYPLTTFSEFKDGLFEMQDEASQCVAGLVEAQPGDNVLDYCAGGGGKALAFAHLMKNRGMIYLYDIRPYVLKKALQRFYRAGIQNVTCIDCEDSLNKLREKMDWVLVDVPCTGTGTLRRNPDQKWRFSKDLLNMKQREQRNIFSNALKFIRPTGRIVYSTCSILRQENGDQLDYFVNNYHLKVRGNPFVSLPDYGKMDGLFAASFSYS